MLWEYSKETRDKLCGVKFSENDICFEFNNNPKNWICTNWRVDDDSDDFTDLTSTDKLECHPCVYVPIRVHLIRNKACVDCVGLIQPDELFGCF